MENREIERGNGRTWIGFLLLVIGSALIVQKFVTPLPWWLFSWKTLLIAIGLVVGVTRGFRGASWLVMILIGGAFLIGDVYPDLSLRFLYWPIILIILGMWMIVSPRSYRRRNWDNWRDKVAQDVQSKDDFLDSVSVLGSVRKVFLSKDFKGGEVTSFMGGTELDLSQADIQGRVVLDITQVFGSTKLVVPSHWDIKSELVSVFSGIEDKRNIPSPAISSDKVLVLKGTSVFGGIEIRSY